MAIACMQITGTPACRLRRLALICGAGQFLGINLAYLLAAYSGHVPWCVPYWDGCASISAAGRRMPEAVLFKAVMLPLAVCVVIYWRDMSRFFEERVPASASVTRWMRRLGVSAAILLAGYILVLGTGGDSMRTLRHALVVLSFTLTYLAQLLITHTVRMRTAAGRPVASDWLRHGLLGLSIGTLLTGVGGVLLELFYSGYDAIEDAVEWNLAALLDLYFVLTFLLSFSGKQGGNGGQINGSQQKEN